MGLFEKSGAVKLQCSTGEGKRLLVRVIMKFENSRVREIGISLYKILQDFYLFSLMLKIQILVTNNCHTILLNASSRIRQDPLVDDFVNSYHRYD